MSSKPRNFMSPFKREYHMYDDSVELYSKHGQQSTRVDESCEDTEYMSVNEPLALAAFVAFCSETHREVFLRGCTRHYGQSVPSLFRDNFGEQCGQWDALEAMVCLPEVVERTALRPQRYTVDTGQTRCQFFNTTV